MTTSRVVSDVVPANRSDRSEDRQLAYRLDVVASDVTDVVRSAGGWLYDRVGAGWEVNVLVPQSLDARALRILGVRTLDLEAGLSGGLGGAGVATSAVAFSADGRIRDTVCKALDHNLTEVTLWGEHWPLTVRHALTAVQHPLSAAARTFKSHALVAAGMRCDSQGLTETFLSNLGTCLPVESDLLPLARTRT